MSGQGGDTTCFHCVARVSLSESAALAAPAQHHDLSPGQVVGEYELEEIIGRGGMGVVYKARQRRLQRTVAIKTIVAERTFLPEAARRLRAEAEALGGLRHSHIVGVHEFLAAEGRLFIVMEFVTGRTLADTARGNPMAPEKAARCVQKLASAVQYAHQRGILHRDLKPANVLIDELGEPRLTDFGLAKRLDSSLELTLSHHILGSPPFMSPEQVSARHGAVDRASDVYSLGAILYFLLTGRPPFAGATLEQTLLQVSESTPAPLRQDHLALPLDLETICLKCLEKDPARRYASAQALEEDLARFLRGEPTLARPLGPLARLARWSMRQPALAALVAVSLVGLAAFAATLLWAQKRILEREDIVRRNAYVADIHLAQQAVEGNNFGHARELLERWSPGHDPVFRKSRTSEDLRGFEWYYLRHASSGDLASKLGELDGAVLCLAFSPDGRWMAAGSIEGHVALWNLAQRREAGSLRHQSRVDALAFSPDSSVLASGSGDPGIQLSAVPDLRPVRPPLAAHLGVLALGYDAAQRSWVAAYNKAFIEWDLSDGTIRRQHDIPGWVRAAFSPDLKFTALAQGDGRIIVWDNSTASERLHWIAHTPSTLPVAFSPDSRWVGSGGFDASAKVWAVESGRLVAALNNHRSSVAAVAFSHRGARFVTASYDQTARVWDTTNWTEVAEFRGWQSALWAVAFSPDDSLLALGAKDGSVLLWPPVENARPLDRLACGPQINALTSAGSAVIGPGRNSNVVERRSLLPPFAVGARAAEPGDKIMFLEENGPACIHRQGRLYFSGKDGAEEIPLKKPFLAFREAFDSPGGAWQLFFWDEGGRCTGLICHAPRQSLLALWPESYGGSITAAFSKLEDRLAIGTPDGEVQLWGLPEVRAIARWRAHTLKAHVAFSPDGRFLATAGEEGLARLWDVATRQLVAEYRTGADAFWSVIVSPDGRRLFAGTGEGTVVAWDVQSRQHLLTLRGHASSIVNGLRFQPDGTLVSVVEPEARFWRVSGDTHPQPARMDSPASASK